MRRFFYVFIRIIVLVCAFVHIAHGGTKVGNEKKKFSLWKSKRKTNEKRQ